MYSVSAYKIFLNITVCGSSMEFYSYMSLQCGDIASVI